MEKTDSVSKKIIMEKIKAFNKKKSERDGMSFIKPTQSFKPIQFHGSRHRG